MTKLVIYLHIDSLTQADISVLAYLYSYYLQHFLFSNFWNSFMIDREQFGACICGGKIVTLLIKNNTFAFWSMVAVVVVWKPRNIPEIFPE